MLYKVIPIKPYHHVLHLFCCSESEFRSKMFQVFGKVGGMDDEWFKNVKSMSGFHTFVEDEKTGVRDFIVWIRPVKRKSSELLLTISHECLHCVFKLLPVIGIPLTEESEEAYTYLHEELTGEIARIIWKK